MKGSTPKLLLLLLLVFTFQAVSFAEKAIPLKEALKVISRLLGTRFLYDKDQIQGKTTTYNFDNIKGKDVEEVLKQVLYPNNLVFLYVKQNYYTIIPKSQVSTNNAIPVDDVKENRLSSNSVNAANVPLRKIRGE